MSLSKRMYSDSEIPHMILVLVKMLRMQVFFVKIFLFLRIFNSFVLNFKDRDYLGVSGMVDTY